MRSLPLMLAAILTFSVVGTAQTTWYVDDDNCPGPGDGSAGNPFCQIQEAVDAANERKKIPVHLWVSVFVGAACIYFIPEPWNYRIWGGLAALVVLFMFFHLVLQSNWTGAVMRWLAIHPLANGKFFFFIFCLMPVQTLFAHNWLTLPMYIERA